MESAAADAARRLFVAMRVAPPAREPSASPASSARSDGYAGRLQTWKERDHRIKMLSADGTLSGAHGAITAHLGHIAPRPVKPWLAPEVLVRHIRDVMGVPSSELPDAAVDLLISLCDTDVGGLVRAQDLVDFATKGELALHRPPPRLEPSGPSASAAPDEPAAIGAADMPAQVDAVIERLATAEAARMQAERSVSDIHAAVKLAPLLQSQLDQALQRAAVAEEALASAQSNAARLAKEQQDGDEDWRLKMKSELRSEVERGVGLAEELARARTALQFSSEKELEERKELEEVRALVRPLLNETVTAALQRMLDELETLRGITHEAEASLIELTELRRR